MSKNITIQEDGVGKQLTVDKLKTNLVGGGTCLWVPEDDVALGSKRILKNGTYRASDDGRRRPATEMSTGSPRTAAANSCFKSCRRTYR